MSIPQILRYVILVPHRDSLGAMEDLRKELFCYGLWGSYSFPLSIPLLRVSTSFTVNELKKFAVNIKKERDKFICESESMCCFIDVLSFYGPKINLHIDSSYIPESAMLKVKKIYSPALLCTSINTMNLNIIQNKGFSFRSACLRNLSIHKLAQGDSSYSFEWKMGREVWLRT